MNLRLSLLPLLMLAACQAPSPPPPLEGAPIGGPFTLVDQDGRTRTDRDFAGKYRIMYFGYTFCPDVCPVDLRNLAQGYRAFATANPEKGKRVVPIFVSVDPERDTPAIMKQYVATFDPAVIGLTGTTAQVKTATDVYRIAFELHKKSPSDDAYLVDHMRVAYLMSPDGKPIALLSQEKEPAVIAGELAKWVK